MMINPNMSLKLLAIPNNSRLFLKRTRAPKYQECFQKMFEQQTCCHFCRHENTPLHIINLDHDYTNNARQNLVLACDFCTYVQHLDFNFQLTQAEQYIIYLPTESQQRLHQHYHHWQKMIKQKQDIFAIQEAIAELAERSQLLDEIIGFKTSFKDQLALLLKPYDNNHSLLSHLRWLPSFEFLRSFNLADQWFR